VPGGGLTVLADALYPFTNLLMPIWGKNPEGLCFLVKVGMGDQLGETHKGGCISSYCVNLQRKRHLFPGDEKIRRGGAWLK
jgi:hypothetical protein